MNLSTEEWNTIADRGKEKYPPVIINIKPLSVNNAWQGILVYLHNGK